MNKILVGIAGPAGCGKNTVADMLGWTQDFFAKPIYDMLEAGGFGRPRTQEEKEMILPHLGFSWRQAAQTLGTEWGRQLRSDLWLSLLWARCDLPDCPAVVVITDVRFPNEAELIRDRGLMVHITGRRKDLGANAGHASEAGLPCHMGDWVLNNSGSQVDLILEVDRLKTFLKGFE